MTLNNLYIPGNYDDLKKEYITLFFHFRDQIDNVNMFNNLQFKKLNEKLDKILEKIND